MAANVRRDGHVFMGRTDKKTEGSMKGMEKNTEKGYFMGVISEQACLKSRVRHLPDTGSYPGNNKGS